jgi:hypothetical protein
VGDAGSGSFVPGVLTWLLSDGDSGGEDQRKCDAEPGALGEVGLGNGVGVGVGVGVDNGVGVEKFGNAEMNEDVAGAGKCLWRIRRKLEYAVSFNIRKHRSLKNAGIYQDLPPCRG